MIAIDYLTVVVAAIVNLILGFLWYSPYVFGKLWLKLVGRKEKEMKMKISSFIGAVFISLFLAFFLALIEGYMGVTSFWDGVIAGALVWLGFVIPTQFSLVIWEKRSLSLFVLDIGNWFFGLIVMGGILAG